MESEPFEIFVLIADVLQYLNQRSLGDTETQVMFYDLLRIEFTSCIRPNTDLMQDRTVKNCDPELL